MSITKKQIIAIAAAVALALVGVVAFAYLRDRPADGAVVAPTAELSVPRKLPPPAPSTGSTTAERSPHGTGIDGEYATVLAMYNAPEGTTPCESAYNAVVAEQEAARRTGRDSIFQYVATRDLFLKHCEALPAASQPCLVPRYQARNQRACEDARPPTSDVVKLYIVREELVGPREPDQVLSE
jgi:hypothetical protein